MSRTVPSRKALREWFGDILDHEYGDAASRKLGELRKYLEQWRDGDGMHSNEVLIYADKILTGHGVEALVAEDGDTLIATYVNMGDTYAPTLLFDWTDVRWRLTTWGDFVETAERRGVKFR